MTKRKRERENFQFAVFKRCLTRNTMHWMILKSLVKRSDRCKPLCTVYPHSMQCGVKSFRFPIKLLCAFSEIGKRNLLRTMYTTFCIHQCSSYRNLNRTHCKFSIQQMFWILLRVPKRKLCAKWQLSYAVHRALAIVM